MTHLPKSNSYSTTSVMVDRLSKWDHFAPLPDYYTAPSVAQIFWDYCGKLHGPPEAIVSNRNALFLSKFWYIFFKTSGTNLRFSSHPQIHGQTERINRCINQFLRLFTFPHPASWSKLLRWAEYHYNTSFHMAAGMSPFEAMFGRAPPNILPLGLGDL